MSAADQVRAAYARIAAADRPEVWITLRPEREALADAAAIDARRARGERLPLAGLTLAVKDNIDAAGLPTTAGCPAYAYTAAADAPAVARLLDAGMVLVGKTNLDQFATGLSGTRSPYGAVRDARRPAFVSGGSSSGSAVAVALGLVDVALGTDTAGSGRVPAAFGGVVGLKPTRGLVPTTGVVPACRSLDCVSVFSETVALAQLTVETMTGPCPADAGGRAWPADAPLGAAEAASVAVARADQLGDLTPAARDAMARVCAKLAGSGLDLVEVDIGPLIEAGRLLYDGAFVAERHAAVGAFVAARPDDVDPTVGAIIAGAGTIDATALCRDHERIDALRLAAHEALAADALLLPTTVRQPTIAEVAEDPVGANDRLGVYSRFANMLDLCAIAVPAGTADGGAFGVTVLAPAFGDRVAGDIARRLTGETAPTLAADGVRGPAGVDLLVLGAHLTGQPLNHQLVARGARRLGDARTAPVYRLYRLATDPPKPGLVRTARGGTAIEGELWQIPPAGLGTLLAELPAPMALGTATLADGRKVVSFLPEPIAVSGAQDISEYGGWLAHLAARDAVSA